MAYRVGNGALETTDVTGSGGTYDLLGAQDGYNSFLQSINDADTCTVRIWETTTNTYEIIEGTFADASPDTISRTSLIESSTGSNIVWGAGTKNIAIVLEGTKVESLVDPGVQATAGFIARSSANTYVARELETGTPATVSFTNPKGDGTPVEIDVDAVPAVAGGTFTGPVTFSDEPVFTDAFETVSGFSVGLHVVRFAVGDEIYQLEKVGTDDYNISVNQDGGTMNQVVTEREIPIAYAGNTGLVLAVNAAETAYEQRQTGTPIFLQIDNPSSQANSEVTIPVSDYDEFLIKIRKYKPQGDASFTMEISDGTYETTNYDSAGQGFRHNGQTQFGLDNGSFFLVTSDQADNIVDSTAGDPIKNLDCEIHITCPGDGTNPFQWHATGTYRRDQADDEIITFVSGGQFRSGTSVTRVVAVRFGFDNSGGINIASGETRLYGINW